MFACQRAGKRWAGSQGEGSTGVAAHVFATGEDVALHGAFEVFFGGAGLEIQFGIKGVELEEIAMRLCGLPTGAAVANFLKVVGALAGAIGGLLGLRETLRE